MNACCSPAMLEGALTGSLGPEQETELQRHLYECEACSSALEQLAGGQAWCREAAALLAEDDLDSAPAREQWSEIDFTVEHLEPADEPNLLGRLGEYDVLEVIGHGGMGVVLKGYDRQLKRCVAIKVLAPHLAHNMAAKKRFAREAQAAAAVMHPNVIAIHQVQPAGRLPFLVMPLVAGESLAERLAVQGPLDLKETLRIGMQAAAGLAAAHEQGLVHRDVKPANILLEKGVERAVLTDFGLARAADDATLTRWGIVAGTPQYMSPEQARGEPLDGRSDLFSLGCVLYEMATGVSPFRAGSMVATMRRLVDESPQPLATLNPELPPWFVAIVDRLLEKDPARRFSSAREVSELLEGCLAHVQQPTVVPLPAGLPKTSADGRRRLPRLNKPNLIKGVLAMIAAGLAVFGFLVLSADPPDIAGDWTGDEWGRVSLKKTAEGEYQGTYTDTFGKEPGGIQLKWSRIERRFNGTWREGEDRVGEISIRLAGDEIRGAYTTDTKSKINPGTPHLVDLAWNRAGAAKDTGAIERGDLSHRVQFELGASLLTGDDRITIEEVRGTADTIKAGNTYEVTGTYRLATRDKAMLTVYVTGGGGPAAGLDSDPRKGLPAVNERQPSDSPTVERGEGKFKLRWHMSHEGQPHVSFYSADGGSGFAHVYFGTGDSVLKKGWWKTAATSQPPRDKARDDVAPHRVCRLETSITVSIIAVSNDAKLIAIANGNPMFPLNKDWKSGVQILDGENGKMVVALPLTTPEEDALLAEAKRTPPYEIKALAFSPDGKAIAVGTSVGQVKVFDAKTGALIQSLDDEKAKEADKQTPDKFKAVRRALGNVHALAFSPDGNTLVTAGGAIGMESLVFDAIERSTLRPTGPGRLKVWDVKTGELKFDLAGHDEHANAVAISPDGHWLASGGNWSGHEHGNGAIIWDLENGKKLRTIASAANGGTWSVAFSPDSKMLAVGSISFDKDKDKDAASASISVVHAGSGILEWRKSMPRWATVRAFAPDQKTIVVLSEDHTIEFIDAGTGTVKQSIRATDPPAGRWIDIAVTPERTVLVTGGGDGDKGSITIWDLTPAPAAKPREY